MLKCICAVTDGDFKVTLNFDVGNNNYEWSHLKSRFLEIMWLAFFRGGNASLASLVDTPHQTRVVELLIVHAESLFGPREDHQLIPAETPVEPLEKRDVLQVPQTATIGE